MILTPQEHAAILQTIQTPGWEIIKKRAHDKIQLAWESLTINDDEKQVLYLFHRSSAAKTVLYEFLSEIEEPALPAPPTPGEFHTAEAEF